MIFDQKLVDDSVWNFFRRDGGHYSSSVQNPVGASIMVSKTYSKDDIFRYCFQRFSGVIEVTTSGVSLTPLEMEYTDTLSILLSS